jgi:quinol-cytochrome oxidoreductase complex cytochrome b subunit
MKGGYGRLFILHSLFGEVVMASFIHSITASRVWKSFFRHGWPDTEMNRSLVMTSNIFFHLHPVKVSRSSIKATYTWGLGVLAIVMFAVLTVTGTLIMFYYVPSTELAYHNIVELQTKVPYGQLMRNMHRWSAHGMVLIVVLHMIRVFYTGAYKVPREFNWIVGVVLLLLTLGGSFTGYLLPWDQLSYWAITVGTNIAGYTPVIGSGVKLMMLGGFEVGQNALTRFYALHIVFIPAAIVGLISLHMWRVRKDGGLAAQDQSANIAAANPAPSPPVTEVQPDERFARGPEKTYSLMELVRGTSTMVGKGPGDTLFSFPIVAILEALLALGAILVLAFFSLARNAPLEELANPDVTTNPAKAPWYFMALQELLLHMHPVLAGIVVPGIVVLFLIILPYFDTSRADSGRWFASKRGPKWVFFIALYTVVAQSLLIYFDEVMGLRGLGAASPFILQIIGPVMFGVILFGIPLLAVWFLKPTRREWMLVIFTIIIMSAITLTISGFLFRGPGMHLYPPWGMPTGYDPWSSL